MNERDVRAFFAAVDNNPDVTVRDDGRAVTPAVPRTIGSEEDEQIRFFGMVADLEHLHPGFRHVFHVPNGGHRTKATAGRMKAAGVKAGVPDILYPAPRGEYTGLAIELKVGRNKPTDKQMCWLAWFAAQGWRTEVCYGADEAIAVLCGYEGG